MKTELPLKTEAEILQLVQDFEACQLPLEHWTHRAHLAVGAFYSRSMSYERALSHMRMMIQRYNMSNDNPTGYNETITCMFLRKMAADLSKGLACPELVDEIQRLVGTCSFAWLNRYYSKERIHSPEAKSLWVEPDLSSLDF